MKIIQKQAALCCLLSQAVCFLAMCLFPLTAGCSSCEEKGSGKLKESEDEAKRSQRHIMLCLYFTPLSSSVGGLMITFSTVYFYA